MHTSLPMKKITLAVLLSIIVIGGVSFLLLKKVGQSKGQAILKVAANPTATIFLDNQNIGKTPFEDKVKPGEYTLKLLPESTVEAATSWEGKIALQPNLLTYVDRDLKDSELNSSGEQLTLEKISGSTAEVSVISTPDGAKVSVDGSDKGATPLVLHDLAAGNYDLAVSATGFVLRSVKIKTTNGYKLNAVFNLAATGTALGASSSASPTPAPSTGTKPGTDASPKPNATPAVTNKPKAPPPEKPYVEIEDTPTGFLNVRAEPSASAEIVSRVNPGEDYALLDEQTVADAPWYKIEYETNKTGWISGAYAKKFE